MPAVLKFIKYTGKSSQFGTEVSSIGLKRVDAAVPAVYGVAPAPGDDKSDVLRYPVIIPTKTDKMYSFESIFKIHLKSPPSNQLSNIRIFPNVPRPESATAPKLFIGMSPTFSRPTNTQSAVAMNDVWDYTEENPFLITIGGQSGYEISPEIFQVYEFQITVGDTGSGNKFYLNGNKQPDVKIIEGNTYTFINNVTPLYTFKIYDDLEVLASHPDIVYGTFMGNQTVTIIASASLLSAFPNGFKYGSSLNTLMGSTISWFDINDVPTETIVYDVEARVIPGFTSKVFYLNDIRKPTLDLRVGKKYIFNNISGDTDPFRLVTEGFGGSEDFVIVDGISVVNGGTVNEVVTVDTTVLNASGKIPLSYESTTNEKYGNYIRFLPLDNVGKYNLNTVGGGTNPLAAGETDYIYLQLCVDKETDVGDLIPNLIIRYDES